MPLRDTQRYEYTYVQAQIQAYRASHPISNPIFFLSLHSPHPPPSQRGPYRHRFGGVGSRNNRSIYVILCETAYMALRVTVTASGPCIPTMHSNAACTCIGLGLYTQAATFTYPPIYSGTPIIIT